MADSTGDPSGWFARTFPVPAPAWVAPALTLVLSISPLGRAQDYLTRTAPAADAARGVEVLGFERWALLFLTLASGLFLGVAVLRLFRNRWVVLGAHVYGAGLHVAYVMALSAGVAGSGRGLGVITPPLGAALVHLVCVGLYVGPRPRRNPLDG